MGQISDPATMQDYKVTELSKLFLSLTKMHLMC